MDMTLTENFPLATRVVPNDQDVPDSFVYNALSRIPIPGAPTSANIQLLNDTKITCYDLPGPFEAREAPAIWNQGAASTQIRIGDTCQRLETIGADYRGAINQTMDGPPCENWGVASPLVCFLQLPCLCSVVPFTCVHGCGGVGSHRSHTK